MTIASATNKSGPYFYNGSATSFAYQFKISNAAHIRVVETVIATGIETDLVLNTDYTVTGVGDDTGNVVITPARAAGKTATLVRKNPFTQGVVLENQGAYFAKVVEGALDDAVARDQQLQEQISRAVVVPVSADATDLETLIGGVIQLLDNVDAVVTVAGISAAVTTVAANAAPTAIVAGNIDAVVISASNMATIIAVPALATQVADDRVQTGQDRTAVATNKGLVDTAKTAVDVAKAAADADVVLTHADVVLTHADAVATAADRVQTGLDRIAAAASAAAAAAYSLVTATLGFAAKTTPADADVFGYVQASDSTGRKFTFGNLKTVLNGLFVRFDISQPIALTQAQKGIVGANIGQAWELVGSAVAVGTAVAQVDFTNLSAYRELRLSYFALPVTDNSNLLGQVSVSGVFNSTAGAYGFQFNRASNTVLDGSRSTDLGFVLSGGVGNAGDRGANGVLLFTDFNQNKNTHMSQNGGYVDSSGSLISWSSFQRFVGTATRDGLRLKFASGNINAGSRFVLEGVRG